jgi:hypothetical protein
MKLWWLRLYTFQDLLRDLRNLGAIGGLAAPAALFYPRAFPFTLLLYVYPIYTFLSPGPATLLANLDFHKMSVPLPELLPATLIDLAVRVLSFAVLFHVALWGPLAPLGRGDYPLLLPNLLTLETPAVDVLLVTAALTFAFSVRLNRHLRDLRLAQVPKESPAARHRFLAVGGGVLAAGVVSFTPERLANLERVNLELLAASLFFLTMIVVMKYFLIGKFHLIRGLFVVRSLRSLLGSSIAACVAFVVVLGLRARTEIGDPGRPALERGMALLFFSDFAPELPPAQVALLLPHAPAPDLVWKTAAPECGKLPLGELYQGRNLRVWSSCLRHGTPAPENVAFLLRELDRHYPGTNVAAVRKLRAQTQVLWPRGHELPGDLRSKTPVMNRRGLTGED